MSTSAACRRAERDLTNPDERNCYCGLWAHNPSTLEAQGVPRDFCGFCAFCGAPGHLRHAPAGPFTSAWCDACYEIETTAHKLLSEPPWSSATNLVGLDLELARELSPPHILSGRKVHAWARRLDNDDVLFAVPELGFAIGHLTWSSDNGPGFPRTMVFSDLRSLVDHINSTKASL